GAPITPHWRIALKSSLRARSYDVSGWSDLARFSRRFRANTTSFGFWSGANKEKSDYPPVTGAKNRYIFHGFMP
ncbi:MAG TPA: hypothetical protein VK864_05210, partial [Longimicrobiales bacterium]|nr:hypothetical protein [Longimicrobiales bacterium]